MPILSIIWQALLSGVPLLFKVPRWVWITGGAVVGALVFAHNVADRVAKQKDLEYAARVQTEVLRQAKVYDKAIESEKAKALEATRKADSLQEVLSEAQTEVSKLKTANSVCLPRSVTDKLRKPLDIRPPIARDAHGYLGLPGKERR